MKSTIKLFTLLSAGAVLGSMAGRIVRKEKLNILRLVGINAEKEKKMFYRGKRFSRPNPDETESCFI